MRFNGFLRNVSLSFENLRNVLHTFSSKEVVKKTIFISRFIIGTIIANNWNSSRTIQELFVLVIIQPHVSRLSDFERTITRRIVPLGPITITNYLYTTHFSSKLYLNLDLNLGGILLYPLLD